MNDEPTDAVLIRRSLERPEVFAAVFDRHFDAVYRYLGRRVGGAAADGLAGEAFRIAFERRPSYRLEHPSALPWLYGIATNLVMKEHRSEARQMRALERLHRQRSEGRDLAAGVSERLDAADELARVAAALAGMDARDRDVLTLLAWEGLGYDAIARALDLPIGTVRSRVSRARERLRELTRPGGEEAVTTTERSAGGCER